jgi:S1-C subfamily serine protease
VQSCGSLKNPHDGTIETLALVAADERNDLALLKQAKATGPPAVFREGPAVRSGETIVAIGYPLRGLLTSTQQVTTGTISALAGIQDDTRFFQITAPVQPGSSGGPLLDESGNVVAVIVGKLDALKIAKATGSIPENVNFAIKSPVALSFMDTHAVGYATARSTTKLDAATIGQRAQRFTIVVKCWK